MDCQQAHNLFDAYLDGELSPSLATELGAHRLQCGECRRALALLEVSEHILSLDKDPVSLGANFSDRLVACVARRSDSWWVRAGRWGYVAGPLAAAAVIVLAFLGVFDGRRATEVAGNRVEADSVVVVPGIDPKEHPAVVAQDATHAAPFGGMFDQVQDSLRAKQRSVESLQTVFDLTLQQPLELFDQAQKSQQPGTAAPITLPESTSPKPEAVKGNDALEDL